jgi:type II secretory pathway component PulF
MTADELGLKPRAAFYQTLGSSLESGLDIKRALGLAVVHPSLANSITAAGRAIEKGSSFGDALAQTGVFPRADLGLIRAGEKSGQLPDALKELADYHTRNMSLRARMTWSLAIPALVFVAAVCAGHLSVWYFQGVNAFVRGVIPAILIGFGGVWIAWLALETLYRHSSAFARLAFHFNLPLIPSPVAAANRVVFYFLYSRMFRAGLSHDDILSAIREAVGNEPMRDEIEAVRRIVASRRPLSEALAGVAFLPRDECAQLASAEASGQLHETADRLYRFHLQRLEQSYSRLPWAIGIVVYAGVSIYMIKAILGIWTGIWRAREAFL